MLQVCICTQQNHISSVTLGDKTGFFSNNKGISSPCGTCLHLELVGSNHSTKNPMSQLGQKSPPVDNFKGSLRNLPEI